jgi:hypothetical protein
MMQAPASMPNWLHAANDGADSLLDVALTGADDGRHAGRACRLVGEWQGRLLLQLGIGDHNDNAAVARFFAEALGVPSVRISVVGGVTSTRKTVRLAGVGQRQALLRLAP